MLIPSRLSLSYSFPGTRGVEDGSGVHVVLLYNLPDRELVGLFGLGPLLELRLLCGLDELWLE